MKDVGVIVGKFQVPFLHEGHIKLINSVVDNHYLTVIVLGVSLSKCTRKHVFDFNYRAEMIKDMYPQVIVVPLKDTPGDDYKWSSNLDSLIDAVIGPNKEVCLYGSRDSFVKYYHGIYKTEVIKPSIYISGTEIRNEIGKKSFFSPDFGRGAVWFSQNQWKGPMMCVDIAVIHQHRIVLGRKKDEDGWRLPGGKIDNFESLEQAADRELLEETNLKSKNLTYVTSMPINDPRYMFEYEKVTSALFKCETTNHMSLKAGDDLIAAEWFSIESLPSVEIVESHRPLINSIIQN